MAGRRKVLVIDDEPNMIWLFKEALNHKYDVLGSQDGRSGLEVVGSQTVDVVMLDLRLPDMDGLDVLRQIRRIDCTVPVIMMTAYASIKNAVEAMKAGAYDYVVKPFDFGEVEKMIRQALTVRAVKTAAKPVNSAIKAAGLVVKSKAMEQICGLLQQVAATEATVLIQGESGTGKELMAKLVHSLSKRKTRPFLPINCAALPETLLEAELFGYEAGAFTGATKAKPGKFELADGGTLFMDEIGDMPLALQGKLLRVLEDRAVEHLGGIKRIKVDFRLVAATNKNLTVLIRKGLFREDLYYRLAVIPVYLPPLRERREEILPLAQHFLEEFANRYATEPAMLSEGAKEVLVEYPWPGNVRELRNLMERMAILHAGTTISVEDLPGHLVEEKTTFSDRGLKETIHNEKEKMERELVRDALKKCNGNRTKAAEYLGVSRRWLQLKLKYYGLG